MPKVASSGASGAGTAPALRRNQACRQCRKRKLKCDAQKPHCSTCVKQWNAQIAVPPPIGFSHPQEPLCTYDHMENLTLTPAEQIADPEGRVKVLEKQIADLRTQLLNAQQEAGVVGGSDPSLVALGTSPGQPSNIQQPRSFSTIQSSLSPQVQSVGSFGDDPKFPSTSRRQPSSSQLQIEQHGTQTLDLQAQNSGGSQAASSTRVGGSSSGGGGQNGIPGNVDLDIDAILRPETNSGNPADDFGMFGEMDGQYSGRTYGGSPHFDMIYNGWNTDLPEPRLLYHLVHLYFMRDTCASRILHRPSFLMAMTLPPTHPDFPHPALLHAICASASRWTLKVGARDVKNGGRDRFAEFHATKTRSYVDQTIATGQNIFSVLLAAIVLSWWFYHEGRWVEIWSHAGFLTRVSIPLGLNFPGTHLANSVSSAYLAPPRNATDLEQRRRAWWICLAFDRIVSVGGWPHSIDERDVGTEFPLRRIDFEAENPVPSNPQDLHSENMLTRHIPQYTDPFNLFIKACMLFGRVTDYNTRMVKLSKNGTASPQGAGAAYKSDPRMAAGFRGLDRLVAIDFLASLPPNYNSCLGVQVGSNDIDGSALDTDLYMVHIIPYAASITLHNPYINFADPGCASANRCLTAARSILNAYYLITSTSFDIKRLHPFVTICWYLAAVVLVQVCKRLIEIGDLAGEGSIWGEINLMRLAMIEYGSVSPIGIRQEKLLQGLMTEILQMTSQAQPLAVGVPLYPFSRKSLYDPTFQPSMAEVVESTNTHNLKNLSSSSTAGSSMIGRLSSSIHSAPLPNPGDFGAAAELSGPDPIAVALGLHSSSMRSHPNVLSSQGIWHPLDELNAEVAAAAAAAAAGGGSAGMDIFEQLGL